MKCFVHVGLDPCPKVTNGPSEAISLAERYLAGMNNDKEFSIYWRKDDFYPHNFLPYSRHELITEIQKEGELTLQLAKVGDEPVLGETVTILSAEEEEKNTREAEEALYFGVSGCPKKTTKATEYCVKNEPSQVNSGEIAVPNSL